MDEHDFPIGSDNKVNISSDSKAEAKKGKEKDCEKESLFGVYFWQQCSRPRPFICRELNLIANGMAPGLIRWLLVLAI